HLSAEIFQLHESVKYFTHFSRVKSDDVQCCNCTGVQGTGLYFHYNGTLDLGCGTFSEACRTADLLKKSCQQKTTESIISRSKNAHTNGT
ncbi:MAG TPA: hypothetical protein PKV80_27935, partial [Leptospiraceae bacterium]|nr:hypothetical protein [Leptospiraceae bacterium]